MRTGVRQRAEHQVNSMLREEVHNKKLNEYQQNIDRNINIYIFIDKKH